MGVLVHRSKSACEAAPIACSSGSAYDFVRTSSGEMMRSVAQILKSKADQAVYTIAPVASVFDALKLMAEKNIGALVVIEGEKIVGIITERDYARKIVLMAPILKGYAGTRNHESVGDARPARPGERRMHGVDDG
jgi:predicted transcriptional regulator